MEAKKPRVVERHPGGGTGGGPIDGDLAVFVEDSVTKAVIAGATVVVESSEGVLSAKTGTQGLVEFSGPAVKGPLSVHVFVEGYIYSSTIRMNSSITTIPVDDLSAVPPPPSGRATVKGRVDGWDVLPAGDRIAQVLPVGTSWLSQRERMVGVGIGLPTNLVVDAPSQQLSALDYELELDVRSKGVLVLGARFESFGSWSETHIGYAGGLELSEGATVMKDVSLSHALDRETTVILQPPPAELTEAGVLLQMELPDDAGAWGIVSDTGLRVTAKVAAQTGAFAEAKYVAFANLTPDRMSPDRIRIIISDEVAAGGMLTLVPPPLPGAPANMGRTLSAEITGADIVRYSVSNGSELVWSIRVLEGTTAALPAPPAGFADPLSGALEVEVSATYLENEFDFNDSIAPYVAGGFALARHEVTLTF